MCYSVWRVLEFSQGRRQNSQVLMLEGEKGLVLSRELSPGDLDLVVDSSLGSAGSQS